MVVLDPPSFATARSSRFSAAADYDKLAALAAPVVEPGGLMLACCNQAGLSRRAFLGLLERGLSRAGRRFSVLASLGQPDLDFPVADGLEGPLKVFALGLE